MGCYKRSETAFPEVTLAKPRFMYSFASAGGIGSQGPTGCESQLGAFGGLLSFVKIGARTGPVALVSMHSNALKRELCELRVQTLARKPDCRLTRRA